MILKVRYDTGEEVRTPVKYAHIRGGQLLFTRTLGMPDGGHVDLEHTQLVEFEATSEPDKPGS